MHNLFLSLKKRKVCGFLVGAWFCTLVVGGLSNAGQDALSEGSCVTMLCFKLDPVAWSHPQSGWYRSAWTCPWCVDIADTLWTNPSTSAPGPDGGTQHILGSASLQTLHDNLRRTMASQRFVKAHLLSCLFTLTKPPKHFPNVLFKI